MMQENKKQLLRGKQAHVQGDNKGFCNPVLLDHTPDLKAKLAQIGAGWWDSWPWKQYNTKQVK